MTATVSELSSGLKIDHFLGRYADPLPIRSRGAFQLVSARREEDGKPCVLVLPGANARPAAIRQALQEVQRAHEQIHHPLIPRVTQLFDYEGIPCLEFDCDATVDGDDMLRQIAESEQRVPYAAGDGFFRSLRMALQAAHAAGIYLGRISLRNVLVAPSGQWFLVGFGRNFPLERENGALDGETVFFAAPELNTGGSPSPMGDYVAVLLMMRSFLPYGETLDALGRVLRGDLPVLDGELFKILSWIELRIFAAPAVLRPSMEEAIEAADRVREILGHQPNPAAFATYLSALIARAENPLPIDSPVRPSPSTIWLGPDAEWIAGPDGLRHRCGRSSRRLVQALVARHRSAARTPLTVTELLEAGWPGERPIPQAGANRVYVELNRIRRMGLRDLIERTPEGYRLAPDVTVHETKPPGWLESLGQRRSA